MLRVVRQRPSRARCETPSGGEGAEMSFAPPCRHVACSAAVEGRGWRGGGGKAGSGEDTPVLSAPASRYGRPGATYRFSVRNSGANRTCEQRCHSRPYVTR